MMDLAGKIVAVTGAGSGIGRALALALVERHAIVALADRDADGLAETHRLASRNGVASQHVLDVADQAAVERFAAAVKAQHGGVHAIVNNAGVALFGTVEQLSLDEMRWLIDINFWGVVYGCKAFLPLLRAQSAGFIVNISSAFGLWGPPGQAAYAASKFAVRGFSEALRGELQDSGISVVTVHPS
ncbi:MAG: SDR family NAD(P)-dependent oxidoreductase, partial [Candidatus Eremiobacteraeota bacterium]|nr:SDR family NAD(P)-dependent oxidoreductase [Candidatus Eremiobacteraeota bacterium]